jgi:hypothetical protein
MEWAMWHLSEEEREKREGSELQRRELSKRVRKGEVKSLRSEEVSGTTEHLAEEGRENKGEGIGMK